MTKGGDIPYESITKTQETLSDLTIKYWFEYNFLTGKWWLLVGLSTVPILIWLFILDKARARQIVLFGALISLTAGILDTIGFTMGFWGYPVKLIPINPPYFPVDFVYLPVMYMLIYQFFPGWKGFTIANILASCFYTFVGEPTFEWLDMYITYRWQYIISLPIYITMALVFKWFVELFVQVEDETTPDQATGSSYNKLLLLPALPILAGLSFWAGKAYGKTKRKRFR
ncbi:CBO0543 family protein [Lentibacillus sp. N15]|uniref:CBO0543 family protein n=1 Tax=Lentibacillus songyuanensis TaxID=3136161 RepID=UPI0031BB7856